MHVSRRPNRSRLAFALRTVAAQIHALGFLLTLAAMVLLLPAAAPAGADHFWACLIFLVTGTLVFLTSSAYHFLHDGFQISAHLEDLLEDIDHSCIYLFIAGTYTPVLLNAVLPPARGFLLVSVWAIAILGIAYTRLRPHLFRSLQGRAVYTGLFVVMGLLFVVRAGEISARLTGLQLGCLIGGCLAYLLGAIGYATRRPALFAGVFGYHELWHVMVLTGATCHFALIYSFY